MSDFLRFLSSADAAEFAATFLAGAIVGALAVLAFCRFMERRERKRRVQHPYLFQ